MRSRLDLRIATNSSMNFFILNSTLRFQVESEKNLMVHKLYELTYDEVKIVEPEFALSKQEFKAFKVEN